MSFNSYCENDKTLGEDTTYNHGLPRCLFETISPLVLLLLIILACIPQLVRIAYKRRMAKQRYVSIQDEFDQSIDATASDLLLNHETPLASAFLDNPAGFIYGENYRTSFLYTCQLFFHICQIILPLLDIVVKGKVL